MSLNDTPSSNRIHIGIFGKRNAGKSSLINAITGQNTAIVSDTAGTTTDPVSKAMELLPLGPVVITDTPGIDDTGELGVQRVERSYQTLDKTDIAIVAADGSDGLGDEENRLIKIIGQRKIPYIVVMTKSDLCTDRKEGYIYTSAKTGENITELKNKIASLLKTVNTDKKIISDLLETGDVVILIMPIDESAPKGRIILPQQQTIRDILDKGAIPVCVRDRELEAALSSLSVTPKIVITDSQVFNKVKKSIPLNIPLTSFSILFARYKGTLLNSLRAVKTLDTLADGDYVLISEGCTHHRQCNDIGTVKMPSWIKDYTEKDINFDFTSGSEFPRDLSKYKLIVHCGGCMLGEREMQNRAEISAVQNIPMTNYGLIIAYMNGILQRSLELFPEYLKELNI